MRREKPPTEEMTQALRIRWMATNKQSASLKLRIQPTERRKDNNIPTSRLITPSRPSTKKPEATSTLLSAKHKIRIKAKVLKGGRSAAIPQVAAAPGLTKTPITTQILDSTNKAITIRNSHTNTKNREVAMVQAPTISN
jgi:hypothetical protein